MQSRGAQLRGLPPISGYFPRQKLFSALNDSKVGVVICDRRMRYKALNKSVAEIHNVPLEAHLGHFFHEIIGDLAEKVIPLWENVFSTGLPLPNLEVSGHLPKRSDVGYWIENLFPLTDDKGRVTQVGCFVIEITPPKIPSPPARTPAGEVMSVTSHQLLAPDPVLLAPLSPREREVVRLVAEGKSNKEISSLLAISVRTVETHRSRIMLKLQAPSIAHLVQYAIKNRIITL